MPPIVRLLILGGAPPDFYRVNGTDYTLPGTLINGNPPLPSGQMAMAAACTGAFLLCLVYLLQGALPWKRLVRWQRVLVVVALVVGFFSAWEVSLQAFARRFDEPAFVADPVTFWKLNPAVAEQWTRGAPNRVPWWERPRRPLPDQARLREKPAGTYRAVFFGESQLVTVDNQEINLPCSYPRVLERLLGQALPGRAFSMINAGVPGFSSWQGVMLCRELVAYQPDLVVFAFGYHDCRDAFATDRAVLTDDPVVHQVRSLAYRCQLFLLLRKGALAMRESQEEKAAKMEPHMPTCRVPLGEFDQNLREVVRMGRTHGFRVAFLIEPLAHGNGRTELMRPYQDDMRRVAREEGALVLDVFTPMQRITPPGNGPYWDDEIHMSSQGHEAVARILLEQLMQSGLEAFRPGNS